MDLDAVRTFLKVAELASFTRAAGQLGASKSRISLQVQALEAELGTRLLQRTTRAVRLTPDGEQFCKRARVFMVDADELATMFQAQRSLRGSVRVDLPVNVAREIFIPRLPEFLAAHPQLDILLSTTDRRVDVVREGFDCVLRIGALADSGLTARRLGCLPVINCASPAYLLKHGVPSAPSELAGHLLVNYALNLGVDPPSFEFQADGRTHELPMRSLVTVNNADAYLAACIAGLGIIQAPRMGMLPSLARGAIAEILPDYACAPMPVSLVHAHGRGVPKRVRAVMNWLAQVLAPHLDP